MTHTADTITSKLTNIFGRISKSTSNKQRGGFGIIRSSPGGIVHFKLLLRSRDKTNYTVLQEIFKKKGNVYTYSYSGSLILKLALFISHTLLQTPQGI